MKIIELLNKIANDEEIPKKINYPNKEKEYIYDSNIQDYRCGDTVLFNTLFSNYRTRFFINDEVEIIEEDKKIEKIDVIDYDKCINYVTHKEKEILLQIRKTQIKFNELIDKVNSLENKQ